MASRKSRGGKSARSSTRSKRSSRSSSMDAITLLKRDHREVDAMLKQFERARSDSKRALAERICTALTVHAQIEEEIFYPAAREALRSSDQDLLDKAAVEHASLKNLISQIEKAPADPEGPFEARVKVLGEYTKHHVKEEESELFPKLRRTDFDGKEIGARLAARKSELMGQSAAGTRASSRKGSSANSGLLSRMAAGLGASSSK